MGPGPPIPWLPPFPMLRAEGGPDQESRGKMVWEMGGVWGGWWSSIFFFWFFVFIPNILYL